MSGADPKKLFYKELSNGSDMMQHLGNAVGWQGLEDEGAQNEKNPGRAAGKITAYAAGAYLGGLLGGAQGAGGVASTDAAESGGTLALNAAGNGTAGYVGSGVAGAAYPSAEAELAAQVPVRDLSTAAPKQGLLSQGKSMLGNMTGGGNGSALDKYMKVNQAMGLLSPQQPQQAPQQMRPPQQQGQPQPLPMPYSNSKQQLPPGVNPATLTEEQRRMLRSQGYQV